MNAFTLLALALSFNASAATSHSEHLSTDVPALQVQVNNPAYAPAVEAFFKERKTLIKIVRNITSDSYVQVSLNLDSQQGTDCRVFVVASNHGTYVQYPAAKSTSLISKNNASEYCQKFLAESLSNALHMVF